MMSFVLGKFFFKKQYSLLHFLSVVFISIGVYLALSAELETQRQISTAPQMSASSGDDASLQSRSTWLVGIAILSVALVLSSLNSYIQDMGYSKWGKEVDESMLMTHLLGLPMFLPFAFDLIEHTAIWCALSLSSMPSHRSMIIATRVA